MQKPERWAPEGGENVSARRLNQVVDIAAALLDQTNTQALDIIVRRVLEVVALPLVFRVKTVPGSGTDLICTLGIATPTTDDEYTVLMPAELRPASRGGKSYTYTNPNTRADTTTPEDQVLIEPYIAGDILVVLPWPDGTLVDMGIQNRAWAEDT